MNRKLNKNGADHLAPEMASGQEVQKRGRDSEDQRGGLDQGLLLDQLRAALATCWRENTRTLPLFAPTNGACEVPLCFPITHVVCMPCLWALECICFVLLTLSSKVVVLLPRAGTMFSALHPSGRGLPLRRYVCARWSAGRNGSHFRWFKQRNVLERLELRKRERGLLKGQKRWYLDQKLTCLGCSPWLCSGCYRWVGATYVWFWFYSRGLVSTRVGTTKKSAGPSRAAGGQNHTSPRAPTAAAISCLTLSRNHGSSVFIMLSDGPPVPPISRTKWEDGLGKRCRNTVSKLLNPVGQSIVRQVWDWKTTMGNCHTCHNGTSTPFSIRRPEIKPISTSERPWDPLRET